jgi:hypothetical protein
LLLEPPTPEPLQLPKAEVAATETLAV